MWRLFDIVKQNAGLFIGSQDGTASTHGSLVCIDGKWCMATF